MAHNAYIAPFGSWVGITTFMAAHAEAFDLSQFKSVNGDDGGVWTPTTPIVIGGSGFDLQGVNHKVSGTVDVSGQAAVSGTLSIGAAGLATFAPTRLPAVWQPFIFGEAVNPVDNISWTQGHQGDSTMGSIFGQGGPNPLWIPIHNVRNGARLHKIRVYITVNPGHTGSVLPVNMPSVQILRTSLGSGVTYGLGTPAVATATSVTDWNAPSAWASSQYWEYTCAAVGGEPMSTANAYWIKIRDEYGANALGGNRYWGALLYWEVTNISDVLP